MPAPLTSRFDLAWRQGPTLGHPWLPGSKGEMETRYATSPSLDEAGGGKQVYWERTRFSDKGTVNLAMNYEPLRHVGHNDARHAALDASVTRFREAAAKVEPATLPEPGLGSRSPQLQKGEMTIGLADSAVRILLTKEAPATIKDVRTAGQAVEKALKALSAVEPGWGHETTVASASRKRSPWDLSGL